MRFTALAAAGLLFAALQPGCTLETDARTARIELPSIQCGMCVKTVSEALKQVPGVKAVHVDEKKRTAEVSYAAGKTDLAQLEMAVAAAGYAANDTKADSKVYDALPDCCKVPDKE